MKEALKCLVVMAFPLSFFLVSYTASANGSASANASARGERGGGGSLVGNGGDTIFCTPSALNDFDGYYTLDFLLEYRTANPNLVEPTSLSDTINRLREIFGRRYPEILPLFFDFMNHVRKDEVGTSRRWLESSSSLVDIKDENIINQIPLNCSMIKNGERKPMLYQTVIRKGFFDPIQYFFSAEILNLQEQKNPLQYSFFMVHEWLWDLTRNVEVIRKLNWLFHSRSLPELSRDDLKTQFAHLGLFQVKLPLCERSLVVKKLFPKPCEQMELADLRVLNSIEMSSLPENFLFRIGDFYGFSKIQNLKIGSDDGIFRQSPLHPRIFEPLYSLSTLALRGLHLMELSEEITRDLRSLENLDLRSNPLGRIPVSLKNLTNLQTLSLTLWTQGPLQETRDIEALPRSLQVLRLSTPDEDLFSRVERGLREARPSLSVMRIH